MTSYGETLSETITLTDATVTKVWAATQIYSETLSLTETPTWGWATAKTYTEVISLAGTLATNGGKVLTETLEITDGATEDQDIVLRSDSGAYIGLVSDASTAKDAVLELIDLLERQKCPSSQTQIALTHDGSATYSAIAIVKRH